MINSEIQSKVNSILGDKKAWRIKRGLEENPFPVNGSYVYYASKGQFNKIGKFSIRTLILFLTTQKE